MILWKPLKKYKNDSQYLKYGEGIIARVAHNPALQGTCRHGV